MRRRLFPKVTTRCRGRRRVGSFRLGNLQEVSPMATRTTHRSSSGKKLYAVRDASGRFKDIQTYERAHRADLKKDSKGEAKTAKKR